jgi:type 1 glutamine amidotransferase
MARKHLIPAAIIFTCGAIAWGQTSPYSSLRRPRVLMHSGCSSQAAEFPRRAISRVLTELNMPAVYIEDLSLLTPENLAQFDVFINSGSVDAITPEQQKAVYDFVQKGGSFLALHNASAGPANGPWQELIGGRFLKHPPPYLMRVHVTEAGRKSPITRGVEDFEVVDEHHFVSYLFEPQPPSTGPDGPWKTSFWTSAPHVLFESDAVDNAIDPDKAQYGDFAKNGVTPLIGGWWREEGAGRVVFFAPGHMAEVMNHPMMQKLYANALEWLARE